MRKILYILLLIVFVLCIDKINAYTEYKIGDVVPYNGMDFYVIKDSSSSEDSVTMLKAEPLTVDEVNLYGGVGTDNNHVNMNVSSNKSYYQTAYNQNGYGGMQYYSSADCYSAGNHWKYDGCLNDYSHSEVKYVVDAWAKDKLKSGLKSARLLTFDELTDYLGYNHASWDVSNWLMNPEYTPDWVYGNYRYWLGTANADDNKKVWSVYEEGIIGGNYVYGRDFYIPLYYVVRPVITILKTALGDEEEGVLDDDSDKQVMPETDKEINNDNKSDSNNKTNESKTTVKVDNTYMSSSILLIILGFIIASISVLIIYKLSNKKK